MGRRLALDTGVLVAAERAGRVPDSWFEDDDDIGLPVIALAEFRAGVACARDDYRPRMQCFLDGFLELVGVLPYDDAVLDQHVALMAWTINHGVSRGQHDLISAATAAATGRTLLTLDGRARFDELPGVEAIVLSL
ncbi:MAG: hypothetical protein FWD63_05865 [Propionibacteriaceae bacterium]|nr:hypothetical protein [Propionibacteriaceae bacterium]